VIGVIGNGFAYTPFISPTYSLVAGATSVNEGAVANFTLNTTNVTSGTSIPYTLSGISSADVFGGALSGNAVVNSSGVATISVSLLNDLLTEGPETLTVTAGGASASTVVNDTSKAIATYRLVASATSVNEGAVANFTLNTTNVAAGTTVGYTLSGVSTADVFGSLLSGSATVNASGIATISVTLLNDLLTEGAETLTVTAGGATASILVNDTSITFVGIIDGGGGGGGGGGDGGNGG
jgi:plastocyanin